MDGGWWVSEVGWGEMGMRAAENAHDEPFKGFDEGHQSHYNTPRDHNRGNF